MLNNINQMMDAWRHRHQWYIDGYAFKSCSHILWSGGGGLERGRPHTNTIYSSRKHKSCVGPFQNSSNSEAFQNDHTCDNNLKVNTSFLSTSLQVIKLYLCEKWSFTLASQAASCHGYSPCLEEKVWKQYNENGPNDLTQQVIWQCQIKNSLDLTS